MIHSVTSYLPMGAPAWWLDEVIAERIVRSVYEVEGQVELGEGWNVQLTPGLVKSIERTEFAELCRLLTARGFTLAERPWTIPIEGGWGFRAHRETS